MLPIFIVDFDSTIVTVESIDELARIALEDNPNKERVARQISDITNQAMEGILDFPTSLEQRLALFQPTKDDLEKTVKLLKENITPSFRRNKAFFQKYHKQIYIISGGFQECIMPVIKEFGITEDHILANNFTYDANGTITGFDKTNLLAQVNGKVKVVASLNHPGKICVIGDGITDYQIKEQGKADIFFAFTENVYRKGVAAKADKIIRSFDELLFAYKLPRSQSYPTSKMKVLLLENISQEAVVKFQEEGYLVEIVTRSLSEDELLEKISDISILCIRSKTEITKKVFEKAKKLQVIGAFCIGTNNIDLSIAAQKGIAVFNAPYSNTRSVVELVIGDIIMLYRNIGDLSSGMHHGKWHKFSKGNFEIRGKKLGIIGYGNIGTQLSILAESIGMQVYFYDVLEKLALGNAIQCQTLQELLLLCDVITLHVDGAKTNKNLIGVKEFEKMKDGVLFLNLSRGHVVDIEALASAIKSGKVAGAAVDVFPVEPKSNAEPFSSPLQGLSNVILTPHIGGSTEEAQRNIGKFVSDRLTKYINTGNTVLSVNFPTLSLPAQRDTHRYIHIHDNTPGVLAQINTIFAKSNVNIEGQYLKTSEQIGYVITDTSTTHDGDVLKKLTQIKGTIRVRVLY
ncbi:MAG TPA: phosphoglycerate dehydrogenase [Candidatus Sulfotelmatobacter sp.]|jgi:D-3-phosphoglycerate dehydrogenase|nr:phosphoglycerate dehydrogenase [Candidatus Sulfotelmatobacter sp.]